MYHLVAKDVMAHPVLCLREEEPVSSVMHTLKSCSHNGFPVVRDVGGSLKFTGMIVRSQLHVLINRQAWKEGSMVHFDDFCTSLSSKHVSLDESVVSAEDLEEVLDLKPFLNPVPVSVQLECPLAKVFLLFRSLGIRHLVVVNVGVVVLR